MSFAVAFGAAGNVERDEVSRGMEELEFRDGFSTTVFSLRHTGTLTRSRPSAMAMTYGIEGSADNPIGKTLRTVTWEKTEEATDPHVVACKPGEVPGSSDMLAYAAGLIIFRVMETLTIEGFGVNPYSRGDYLNLGAVAGSGIKPAVGSAEVEVYGEDWFCRRADVVKESVEWQVFTAEFVKYTGNTAAQAEQHILALELWGSAEASPPGSVNFYTIRQTTTLNAEDRADFEEALEIFEGSAECPS